LALVVLKERRSFVMSTQIRLIAAAVATLAAGQAVAQYNPDYGYNNGYNNGYHGGYSRTVRCESYNGQRNFCRVDNRGDVRIRRQLSSRPCIEGRNWDYNTRGIWVSNGCRADFAVRGRGYDHDHDRYSDTRYPVESSSYVDNNGDVVRCDSTGDGRTYCSTEVNRRYTLSRTRYGRCVEGETWGIDNRGLWVSGGCRGDFGYMR
jgi:hypothetical protein